MSAKSEARKTGEVENEGTCRKVIGGKNGLKTQGHQRR